MHHSMSQAAPKCRSIRREIATSARNSAAVIGASCGSSATVRLPSPSRTSLNACVPGLCSMMTADVLSSRYRSGVISPDTSNSPNPWQHSTSTDSSCRPTGSSVNKTPESRLSTISWTTTAMGCSART
jgi:hypothetical protein